MSDRSVARCPSGRAALTLDELVSQQVAAEPEVVAIRHRSGPVNYRELWDRSGRWLGGLLARGIQRGDLVGVCLHRTPDLVAALLAVQRAGAAYVPLDPSYPRERIDYILRDSRASVVLAQAETVEVLGDHAVVLAGQLPVDVERAGVAAPDDLAYVIYTSGSTGSPKGVAIEHRQAIARVQWAHEMYSREELGGVLASTSVCFDLSVFELFATLTAGGTVVLADNALELPDLPDRDRVTLINTVPSAMGVLTRDDALPASVCTVNLAGEPLTRALVDAVYATPTVRRVFNLYGPSEDTTYSTWALVPRDVDDEPPIGTPLRGTRAYLLDDDGVPVPDGEIGELFLSGAGVARGYLHRPELTAQRFNPDPWVAGARMYRTGDLCLRAADGQLHYRGRTDHQVKIRGFRVELGEIEAILARHPDVASSVVVVREDAAGGKVLVGFVEAIAGADAAPQELLEPLRQRLPDYMVPARLVVLPALPLTPNGKVDREALPDVALHEPQPVGSALEGPLEHEVARVWVDVLGRPDESDIPADVAFADLGGHSLLAASVLSRLARDTGRRVRLPQFPVAATVRDLAATLLDVAPSDEGPLVPGPSGSGRTYPAAPVQVGFWVLDHVTEGRSAISVMPLLLQVEGALDSALLQEALDLLPTRHEVLRTAIREDEGGDLVARVEEPRPVPLEVVTDRAALDDQARRPLDIRSGQLLAAAVLTEADGRHSLLLRLHHAAGDGWSIGLLVRDLSEVYAALASGRVPHPAPDLQFADCAVWLDDARQREHARMLDYWRIRLAGLGEEQSLPATRRGSGTAELSRPGSRITRALDPALVERIRAFARTNRVTEYAVLLAATALRIHRETGNSDVAMRVPVSNRRRPEFEPIVGPFLETALARVDVSGDPTFAELATRVARAAADDIDNSWIESVHVLELSGVARDSGGKPVSQMLVAVQNYPAAAHTAGGLRWVYVNELDNGSAKTDLGCFWELDVADGPLLNIEYDTTLHTGAAARRLAAQLERIVDGAVSAPDRPVGTLAWVDDTDLQIIGRLNEHEPLWASLVIPTEISRQAARTPHVVAIDCPYAGSVSYADLQRRALVIAARVTEATGGPGESPVAVACRRSADGIAAMLGTWYAGRPYLPLDTAHPVARLRDILEDSGAVAVVADDSCPDELACVFQVLDADGSAGDPAGTSHEPDSGAPAYFIYTSGSTGRPKGVRISHGALAAFLLSMDDVVPLTATDTVPAVTTPSFDIAGLEMWLPLRLGARIGVVTEHSARDGFALADRIAELAATVVQLTPSGWHLLVDAGWPAMPRFRALAGAEPVPPTLAAQLHGRCTEVWNVYGPTEATIWSCVHRIREQDTRGSTVPVGRPLANTHVYVLDHAGQLAPVGTTGLIHLAGNSLADGYHRRDELTQAAFTQASSLPGAPRIYRTGDRGVLREDGLLECLGRADNQVKVRGVRIELEEVDAVLRAVPGVARATCRVQPDGPAAGQLIGYIVRGDDDLTSTGLREAAALALPAAMVPTLWEFLADLPLNTSGKIDRRALPAPTPTADASEPEERSELEEFLAEIWLEHLPVTDVGRDGNFFDCGGHSLTATRVVAAVRDELDVELEVRTLFREPSLRGFAAEVERALIAQEQLQEAS